MVQILWKRVWRFLDKLNIELLYNPMTVFLDVYPERLMRHSNKKRTESVYTAIIHNSAKVETTQMSINRQMEKQKEVKPHSRILLGYKKE